MEPRGYIALDIETVKPWPDGENWRNHRPLGIGCVVAQALDLPSPFIWHGIDAGGEIAERMSSDHLAMVVCRLMSLTEQGYTLLTWNGLGFDFEILAEESGMWDECRQLAINHVDMMFHLFCRTGYPLALATAARGMNLPGKTEGMDGKQAVQMWQNGDRQPVLDYCIQDARLTLQVAYVSELYKMLPWTSRRGNPMRLSLANGWFKVLDAMDLPEPDTSWMTDPIPRSDFIGWL